MIYKVVYSNNFKKNLRKIIRQGKDLKKLEEVVDMLAQKQKLDVKYQDHVLHNDKRFKDCRDCHIEPDWVLIYKYLGDALVLLLVNTDSHSEIL